MKAANEGGGSGREDRVSALQTTAATLAGSVKTHASGGSIRVEEILPTAGELLRRSRAVSQDLGVVDQALSALSPAEVSKYLESLELSELSAQLSRAAEEAMEAGLAETKEEQELWAQSATDALFARDRAESVKVALERWTQLRADVQRGGVELFTRRLNELDRALVSKARTMTALNGRRRAERELLDPAFRESAWWFSARSECDQLLRMLAGEVKPEGEHLAQCQECQRDLSRTRTVEQPPERHVSPDELWQFELGALSREEQRRLKAHAEECLDCAQLFWAMDEGDKAIAQLEAEDSEEQHAPALSRRAHPRELIRRDAYRVLALRGPRMRVLVQPTHGRGLALAVMAVPPQRNIFEAKNTPEGLEFDLGETKELQGRTARLTVRVHEGGDNEVLDVVL